MNILKKKLKTFGVDLEIDLKEHGLVFFTKKTPQQSRKANIKVSFYLTFHFKLKVVLLFFSFGEIFGPMEFHIPIEMLADLLIAITEVHHLQLCGGAWVAISRYT